MPTEAPSGHSQSLCEGSLWMETDSSYCTETWSFCADIRTCGAKLAASPAAGQRICMRHSLSSRSPLSTLHSPATYEYEYGTEARHQT
eukprot:scaffold304984_cov50-Prasinocladus_malaysianus.AAC.1